MRLIRQNRQRGNALMEYVVPAGVILLSAGVLVTAGNAASVLGEYFLSASGHTSDNLSGGVFKTNAMAAGAYGDVGNGQDGFTAFGGLLDGNLQPTGESAAGVFYLGDYSRTSGRKASTDPEYLFP